MNSELNAIELLAGVGIFLFGMYQLEDSLKQLSGGTFRKLIRKFTENWFRSVLSGTLATAVLQSSTAVSLMVLAFAGAGVLGMESAIGVIIGSNLGTTLTSWIVATLGFKVNIEILALPFVGVGGLGLIFFGTSGRGANICKFLVGFGLLFMGLDYMKTSIEGMAQHYDLSALQHYPGVVFILIGFVLTAIIQSSSASMAIILSAINSGILSFPLAAYMVIGINLGTTLTVLIGSLGSQTIKKRVAFSHLLFNTVTALLAIIIFPLLIYLVEKVVHLENDPVTAIALFHTLFNLLGVVVFLPLIGFFTRFIMRVIQEKKTTLTRYLHTLKPDVPEAGIAALKNEIRHLVIEVMQYHLRVLKLMRREPFLSFLKKENLSQTKELSLADQYQLIKQLEAEIYTFASGLQMNELHDLEARELNKLLHATRNAVASAKILKDIQHNLQEAENSDSKALEELMLYFKDKWDITHQEFIKILEQTEVSTNISLLHNLTLKNKEDDIAFTQLITASIAAKKIKQSDIPTLITINRAFNISVRQMIHALRDLLFTEPEAEIVEKLSETTP
ncbi:MAG TPA: Na/Pi symporter [Cyclobacteriaceae bacterium]|nr:Na/Pi symporter [Cyclobacteriaceae bacterium]HRJ82125.1 Na/Pi symporter [Cyclobacteriaceae bacterium]